MRRKTMRTRLSRTNLQLLGALAIAVAAVGFASDKTPATADVFFQAEDVIRDHCVTGVQTCALPILTNMAKFAGLPWDLVMSAELFEHYKPDPETYLGAAKLLCLPPERVMMVAAHNSDLKAAQKLGLKTAFVARPAEYGPLQKRDFEADGEWDIVAKDFGGIADKMGC